MPPVIPMLRRSSIAVLGSVAMLACGLTSVQRQAVRTLGEAAVTTGRYAADAFPEMRQAAIALNATGVQLGERLPAAALDEGFRLPHIEPRVRAAVALEDYGRLLQALVDDAGASQLTAAAARFVASARSVPGRRLSDEQYQALGRIVEGIGGMLIERRKARAIARIVPAYRADVDHLCDLLVQDFDPHGMHLAQRFEITLHRLESDVDRSLASHQRACVRRTAVRGLQQITEGRALLAVMDEQGRTAIQGLRNANATLDGALRDETFSIDDVRAVAVQAQALAVALRTLARSETGSR